MEIAVKLQLNRQKLSIKTLNYCKVEDPKLRGINWQVTIVQKVKAREIELNLLKLQLNL